MEENFLHVIHFGLYFFPSSTHWYGFLLSEALEWISAQWSSNVLLRYRGWGASEVSNIFTQGGLIIKNIPQNLSQSWPLILQSIFHKDRNERK